MAKFDELVVIHPSRPNPLVFSTVGAVKVTAFGLQGNDCIHFLQVRETSPNPTFSRNGCSIYEPTAGTVSLAAIFAVGDCVPTIHAQRPSIFISQPDKYLPVVVGDASDGNLMVVVEPVDERYFSAAELGVEPCGCLCVDTEWTWTGQERCNKGVIEREYQSNCGKIKWDFDREEEWEDAGETRCTVNGVEKKQISSCGGSRWMFSHDLTWEDTGDIRCVDEPSPDFDGYVEKKQVNDCGVARWVRGDGFRYENTGETRCENHVVLHKQVSPCGQVRWAKTDVKCGYCASLPFVVSRCDGVSQLGYAFAPDDERDPDASVPLEDCDGVVHGYIYPTAGAGRTLALMDCEGNVLGYLVNRSDCAPDVVCVDCGDGGGVNALANLSWVGHDLLLTMTDGTSRVLNTPVCD